MQEVGGSTDRKITKLANGNISYHRSHVHFMNGGWPRVRRLSALLFSVSLSPLLSKSLNFDRS